MWVWSVPEQGHFTLKSIMEGRPGVNVTYKPRILTALTSFPPRFIIMRLLYCKQRKGLTLFVCLGVILRFEQVKFCPRTKLDSSKALHSPEKQPLGHERPSRDCRREEVVEIAPATCTSRTYLLLVQGDLRMPPES